MSPEDQTKAADASANSQEDALISVSISTKYQTEVIHFNPITESYGTADSQNSDVLYPGHNEIETMETVDLDKHEHCHGETTDKTEQTCAKANQNESAQCQMVEVSKVRTEVKNISTQTEDSQELILGDKQPPVHACTQTDGEQLEMGKIIVIKSLQTRHPLSLTSQSVTNQLFVIQRVPHEMTQLTSLNASCKTAAACLPLTTRPNTNRMALPEVVMKG